jgi:hypothetical protein
MPSNLETLSKAKRTMWGRGLRPVQAERSSAVSRVNPHRAVVTKEILRLRNSIRKANRISV